MFNSVEYVRKVCKEKKIPISTLEKECGFSNGYLNPKKLSKIPYDRAVIISKYLNIDVNKLLEGDKETNKTIKVYDEHDNIIVLDNEALELIDSLRSKPEMQILFSVSKNATKEDIMKAVKIIEALKDNNEYK